MNVSRPLNMLPSGWTPHGTKTRGAGRLRAAAPVTAGSSATQAARCCARDLRRPCGSGAPGVVRSYNPGASASATGDPTATTWTRSRSRSRIATKCSAVGAGTPTGDTGGGAAAAMSAATAKQHASFAPAVAALVRKEQQRAALVAPSYQYSVPQYPQLRVDEAKECYAHIRMCRLWLQQQQPLIAEGDGNAEGGSSHVTERLEADRRARDSRTMLALPWHTLPKIPLRTRLDWPSPHMVAVEGPPADAQAALRRVLYLPYRWMLRSKTELDLLQHLPPEEVEARAAAALELLPDAAATYAALKARPGVLLRNDFNGMLQHLMALAEALAPAFPDGSARGEGGGSSSGRGGGGGGCSDWRTRGMTIERVRDLLVLGLPDEPVHLLRQRVEALIVTLREMGAKEPKQLAAEIIMNRPAVLGLSSKMLTCRLLELHRCFADWPVGSAMRAARYSPTPEAGVWLTRCLKSDGGEKLLLRLQYAAHLRNLAASGVSFLWDPKKLTTEHDDSSCALGYALVHLGFDPTEEPHLAPTPLWDTLRFQQWKEGRKTLLARMQAAEVKRLVACGPGPHIKA